MTPDEAVVSVLAALDAAAIPYMIVGSLAVGQTCLLRVGSHTHQCEVVRSRLLSNGRHEMAVMFRNGT